MIVGAVIGGSGMTGLVFFFMRRYIERRLEKKEAEDEKQKNRHLRRLTIDDEWQHALGRVLFFIHKSIVTGEHNGDLENAWEKFQDAEEKKKELDREIIVENEIG